ncbi:MAG: glutamate synthase [Deltaproteobacteria bacterium]
MYKRPHITEEKDACAIIAFVDKRGRATHALVAKTIEALRKMGHRSGDIDGEGDGCGIMTDIPRDIWSKRLDRSGVSGHLAESAGFCVGHFLIPARFRDVESGMLDRARSLLKEQGVDILMEIQGATRDWELGPRARSDAPLLWQVAGFTPERDRKKAEARLFRLCMRIEAQIPDLHIASFSHDSVVYKLRGMPELLPRVYPELADEDMRSIIALGHSRYSTNTLPTVERAQPFSILGHNGEINTIERLRSTGRALGIPPTPDGSDSQDLDRVLEGLIHLHGLDLLEAMEMVFPPIYTQVESYREDLRRLYAFYRWFFPCSAQGPAAVVARSGWVCMGSVDALGLRPLWFGEGDYDFFLSSEKGVVDLWETIDDPRPLAPGEKIAIVTGPGRRTEVLDYWAIQKRLVLLMDGRKHTLCALDGLRSGTPEKAAGGRASRYCAFLGEKCMGQDTGDMASLRILSAFGWQKYDLDCLARMAREGKDVIGSMGYQGPLAFLCQDEALPPISEYFKENVAVVTNPAIDREREAEHFSTRTILGDRPDISGDRHPRPLGMELDCPILLAECSLDDLLDADALRSVAKRCGISVLEDVLDFFTAERKDMSRVKVLDTTFSRHEGLDGRMKAIRAEARKAVEDGAVILVLDDHLSFRDERTVMDPALAVSVLVSSLEEEGLRRRTSVIVRSAAIRNLHDVMFLLGLGADALCPYIFERIACSASGEGLSPETALVQALNVLKIGMEKVMSTMGIHELCGYGRIFASIGLARDLAAIFGTKNFCEADTVGLTLRSLEEMAWARFKRATGPDDVKIYAPASRNPRVGRVVRSAAIGKTGHKAFAEELARIEEDEPIALRHLLSFRYLPDEHRISMQDVDLSIAGHDLPIIISAMSFGSQGENSFRTYAEAAVKANIVCMNGEGGEIPDMLGRYRRNRGQQIASGRFGVSMELLNSADFLEIKIGQGAKPGEGGHLPGIKVSDMVARARHCKPGITLISPSNQHDIYSIEDLAQIVTELKTANPYAKVSVKIPVTSGVGTIAVGIAKAGADIINLSGFEGGTGAAREHAKRYVGLPVEIGVSEAHRALVESGLRGAVEIWCDGGLRSPADCVKMILLGANRVGFGTVALMSVGCISCEKCHLDRCPRGISTQLRTKEEAAARGVKGFSPRVVAEEAENLARLIRTMGDGMRDIVAGLGARSIQDLVGRVDLLEQSRLHKVIDLSGILAQALPPAHQAGPVDQDRPGVVVRRPLNYLTELVSGIVMDRFSHGNLAVRFTDTRVQSTDRAVGTYLAGAMVRAYAADSDHQASLSFESSVPGNGLCAFMIPNLDVVVDGGSQDGAAKGAMGGRLAVLKGVNCLGRRVDGSTGKSFAYGAIGGTFMIQNYADSRACIRMSGADVVFGARITAPVRDHEGNIAIRAHLKGFAFEYMTGGRAVVLGDPGPWICSGMTGGVVYQCLYPEFDFTRAALERRLARGAHVEIHPVHEKGLADIEELLSGYIAVLQESGQGEEAEMVGLLLSEAAKRFVSIEPMAIRTVSAA